jgi:hypothetical protein
MGFYSYRDDDIPSEFNQCQRCFAFYEVGVERCKCPPDPDLEDPPEDG